MSRLRTRTAVFQSQDIYDNIYCTGWHGHDNMLVTAGIKNQDMDHWQDGSWAENDQRDSKSRLLGDDMS